MLSLHCTAQQSVSQSVSQPVSQSVSQVEPKSSSERAPTEHGPWWAILCSNSQIRVRLGFWPEHSGRVNVCWQNIELTNKGGTLDSGNRRPWEHTVTVWHTRIQGHHSALNQVSPSGHLQYCSERFPIFSHRAPLYKGHLWNCWQDTSNCKLRLFLLFHLYPRRFYICKLSTSREKQFKNLWCHHHVRWDSWAGPYSEGHTHQEVDGEARKMLGWMRHTSS